MTNSAADSQDRNERRAWLASRRQKLQREQARMLHTEARWSWARILTFFATALAWYPLGDNAPLVITSTALLLGLFALCVWRHHLARDKRQLTDRVLLMVDESLSRCEGHLVVIRSSERPDDANHSTPELSSIVEDGPTWTLTAQECDDLDFYSLPVGLFGLLNRSSTVFGLRRLRDVVEHPLISIGHIQTRQEAVRWLDENSVPRLTIMGAAAVLRGQDTALGKLAYAIRDAAPLPWPRLCITLRVWSLITSAVMLAAVVQVGTGHIRWGLVVIGLLLANGTVYAMMRHTLRRRVSPWKDLQTVVNGYLHAATVAADALPDSAKLDRVRECLAAAASDSVLPALRRHVAWADAGGVMHDLLNILFFYDLHVVARILRCAVPNRDTLLNGLAALGDLEALTSLASFAYETGACAEACYPTFAEEQRFSITGGRHPLITPGHAVSNDLELNPSTRICVVTGSNMAGKSTFLRMCGVNCLLAQIGTVAASERMILSPVRLITDLRARDDLAENESYFSAEVRNLRRLVVPDTAGGTIFGLIDEPFRGTNSDEQVAAGLAVLEHLLNTSNFCLVATHEQLLADLADRSENSVNHHFQENLDADGLVFDYRLRPGPARTRNALRILKRSGYPEQLLMKAHQWLRIVRGRGNPETQ